MPTHNIIPSSSVLTFDLRKHHDKRHRFAPFPAKTVTRAAFEKCLGVRTFGVFGGEVWFVSTVLFVWILQACIRPDVIVEVSY
jgi:hypothetical protein